MREWKKVFHANRNRKKAGVRMSQLKILHAMTKIPCAATKTQCRASLVAQWLGVCLPMQGTRVRALVWEDPTCRGAAGPREPQLLSLRVWSLCSVTGEAAIVRGPLTAMRSGPRLPQLEKALAQKRRPNTTKNK